MTDCFQCQSKARFISDLCDGRIGLFWAEQVPAEDKIHVIDREKGTLCIRHAKAEPN